MPINDIKSTKILLRSKYKAIREKMTKAEKQLCSEKIISSVAELKEYKENDVLFTYVSKDIEVDTTEIIKMALMQNKQVIVPKCVANTRNMDFYRIDSLQQLEKASFGLMEPITDKCVKITDFCTGVCLVPGLSFDMDGFRLGYGKGYYDRFLSQFTGITVGLCYNNSISHNLPHGFYDKAVDILVTDKDICRFDGQR